MKGRRHSPEQVVRKLQIARHAEPLGLHELHRHPNQQLCRNGAPPLAQGITPTAACRLAKHEHRTVSRKPGGGDEAPPGPRRLRRPGSSRRLGRHPRRQQTARKQAFAPVTFGAFARSRDAADRAPFRAFATAGKSARRRVQ